MTLSQIYRLIRESLSGEQRDYTVGSMRRAVFLLSIPMILEMCMESVFALVDIFFVGRLGKEAVATVGLTESVIALVYSIAIGLEHGSYRDGGAPDRRKAAGGGGACRRPVDRYIDRPYAGDEFDGRHACAVHPENDGRLLRTQ